MGHEIRQQELIEKFKKYPTWEERYKALIEFGKKMPPLAESEKTDEWLVRGCQSRVWLLAKETDGKIHFRGDSDALIVRGLVSLVLYVYEGLSPQEILSTSPEFIKELGFDQNLSQARSNGLRSMIKQIQNYAVVYKYKMDQKA